MLNSLRRGWNRRQLLQAVPGLLGSAVGLGLAWADERPEGTQPRATSGDPVEPNWEQRLTLTVGPHQADLVNRLRETRQPLARVGIRLGAQTRDIRMSDNQIEGFAVEVADLRQP